MSVKSYREYVADTAWQEGYVAYQGRYVESPRESDKQLVEIVREVGGVEGGLRVLDVGCSTGNLFRLLSRELAPSLSLSGCDLAEEGLTQAGVDPDLAHVAFSTRDVTDLGYEAEFDVVTCSALLYLLAEDELYAALRSINAALAPGGALVVWDLFSPFEQELSVVERSGSHPEGLPIRVRSYQSMELACYSAGFSSSEFRPFEIPVELGPPQGMADVSSYTVDTEDHGRLIFRGAFLQPWCFLIARKG